MSDDALAQKLAGLSALADDVTTKYDPAGQLLADQINASDPGVFTPHQIADVVRATLALCAAAGVGAADVGPHVVETVLGHREFGASSHGG